MIPAVGGLELSEEAAGLHMTPLPVGQKDHHPKQGYRCRSCTIGEVLREGFLVARHWAVLAVRQ